MNEMNFESNLANHFGVSISFITVDFYDTGLSSLTALVNGVPFDVFFNARGEITSSCPVYTSSCPV
jgi:hypothetical protein